MAANVTNGTDVNELASVLTADQIANLSVTLFLCFFLCFVGYGLYWCQNTKERMEKTRLALERNREINKHLKKTYPKSVNSSASTSQAGASGGERIEIEEKNEEKLALPKYNDQIRATVAAPVYKPLEET